MKILLSTKTKKKTTPKVIKKEDYFYTETEEELRELLQKNPGLTRLSIHGDLNEKDFTILKNVLIDNETIYHICLSYLKIDDKKINILLPIISSSNCIQKIDLSYNNISDSGFLKLLESCAALYDHDFMLEFIDLSGNIKIGCDDIMRYVLETVDLCNKNLVEFNLSDSNISQEKIEKFCQKTQDNIESKSALAPNVTFKSIDGKEYKSLFKNKNIQEMKNAIEKDSQNIIEFTINDGGDPKVFYPLSVNTKKLRLFEPLIKKLSPATIFLPKKLKSKSYDFLLSLFTQFELPRNLNLLFWHIDSSNQIKKLFSKDIIKKITALDLSHSNFKYEKLLSTLEKNNTTLDSFILDDNNLSSISSYNNLNRLFEYLKKNDSLRKLSLKKNKINNLSLKNLVAILCQKKIITDLNLRNNSISDNDIDSIIKLITNSPLEKLDLNENNITEAGVKEIIKACHLQYTCLTEITFPKNIIGKKKIEWDKILNNNNQRTRNNFQFFQPNKDIKIEYDSNVFDNKKNRKHKYF
jgi:hypothetical protein